MPKVVSGYKEAAKARIVEAAMDVFTRRGFDGATMDEIAAKVGVSKAAIYQYYPSKDALLEEVFMASQTQLRQMLTQSFEGRSIRDGIVAFYDGLDRAYGKNYDLFFEWLAQAFRDERIRRLLRADGERDIETVSGFIRNQKEFGALRARMQPITLAQILETAFVGAWVRTAMGHDRAEVLKSLQNLLAILEVPR